jgi:hypothetical protein
LAISGKFQLIILSSKQTVKRGYFPFGFGPRLQSRKYYASYNSMAKMGAGEAVISWGECAAVSAFSTESRYVAELSYSQHVRYSRIRVVELASGKQVSAFGTIAPNAIAMSPDGVTREKQS